MRTEITNTSGNARHFGWIPPHGVDLANGEEITIEGELRSVLASGRNRYSRRREIAGLNADIQAGNVSVVEVAGVSSSPSESPSP
jgi:hypothetical protein